MSTGEAFLAVSAAATKERMLHALVLPPQRSARIAQVECRVCVEEVVQVLVLSRDGPLGVDSAGAIEKVVDDDFVD
eukprot:CAMPEP_0175595346 /NCGR_PEP_ID=MMETSP0096-20121207/54923_1 /TAXON_ID=311494 /ORGANISM="Alexandrium monilatum, Strain CCMP3105" /LENGTH=75 /DNA_ID=CAMNT_0016899683 /DNA_START=22 /DNA_END=247 /DNA_ORIENTATION=-